MSNRIVKEEGGLTFTELLKGEKFCREEWKVEGALIDWLKFRNKMHLTTAINPIPINLTERDKIIYHVVTPGGIKVYGVDPMYRINCFSMKDMAEGIKTDKWIEIIRRKVKAALDHGNFVDSVYNNEVKIIIEDIFDYTEKAGGLVLHTVGHDYFMDRKGYLFTLR